MSYDLEAVIKAYPDSRSCDETKGPIDKDGNFFVPDQAKVDAARVELNKLKYKDQRKFEYPSIGDQLDDLYKDILAGKVDATGEFAKAIKTIKDKYPKS
tara:strand:- start:472 stop:768 length:297 start_codon:yes stop_codon:yes gene_type:complete